MNKKNIIVIVIVAIVAFIAIRSLSTPADTNSSLSSDVSTVDSTSAKYIYSILQKMKEVKLDDKIFADEPNNPFLRLKDNTVTFSAQEAGRTNPFSPVGSDVAGAGRTTSTTTPTR